jgi:class 3 adenylate cyclase
MPELPSGTVTLLFTDIEGSTRLLEQLGERYAGLLADHHRLLRDVFTRYGGREVDTQGDAFFVAFPRAKDAVAAAVHGQRVLAAHAWPAGVEVRVRMGLHTGEPAVAPDRYVGLGVHRAARISGVGHGGQILLSNATRELIADEVPAGVAVRDLGEHRLKDLGRPERLYQLVVEGLPHQFPPLNAPRHAVASAFVGREPELDDLTTSLEDALAGRGRLVLLAGEAGIGKSCLADEMSVRARARGARGITLRDGNSGRTQA